MNKFPRFYYRDQQGDYYYSILNYPAFWLVICLAILFVSTRFNISGNLDYFVNVSLIATFALLIYLICLLAIGIKKQGSLINYVNSLVIADSIRYALLNTMNVNRVKDSPFIEVPNIEAVFTDSQINLTVGKLAGMHDLNQIKEDVDSSLRGYLAKWAVTSSAVSLDGTSFEFVLEDVNTSQRFIIENNDISKFVSTNVHEINLAKNLTWNAVKTPMLSIVGRTRSGKTVFSKYLLEVMQAQGWEIKYYSCKNDIFVKQFDGEAEPIKIIESLEQCLSDVKKRNLEIKKAGKIDYTQMEGMSDVALVIDEIGLLNGQLAVDSSLRKRWEIVITALAGVGASAGFHIIAMSQRATKDFFLPPSALVNARDGVIILGLSADSGDDRRSLIPGFDIPHRSYSTGQGLAMIVSSDGWGEPRFYETPYFEDLKKEEKSNE